MQIYNICIFLFIIKVAHVQCSTLKDEYHEELLFKPLMNNYVYSHFQFTTLWETNCETENFDHCHLFPRPFGEVIGRFNVQELHLSLTKGLWRHETWGYPIEEAPPGAEVWAWFKNGTTEIDKKWKELTAALSGLICASLNFIDTHNTISPQLSHRPRGIHNSNENLLFSNLRYSSLPREIVCTENLTPWKKLLPCNARMGLAVLLNSDHIYNTIYHSLGIHFRPVCMNSDCTLTGFEFKQSVALVYDMAIIGRNEKNWSAFKFFGHGITESCPLAVTSRVYVDVTSNLTGNPFTLKPKFYQLITSTRGGYTTNYAVIDMKKSPEPLLFNIEAKFIKPIVYNVNIPPSIYTNRFITGYGQEMAGITTKIYNKHWRSINVTFMENIPWFIQVYFHTLKVITDGKINKPLATVYVPGKDRERPYYLEVMIKLPPKSLTTISIQFEHSFLKWQEYPPDANHGFYIGAAVLTAILPTTRNYTGIPQNKFTIGDSFNASSENGYPVRITTEILNVVLPTPDFSMPYNVICLACTVVALAFGPLHNITTKRFVLVKNYERRGLSKYLHELKESLSDELSNSDERIDLKLYIKLAVFAILICFAYFHLYVGIDFEKVVTDFFKRYIM